MFSLLSAAIANAVDVLAPPLPLQEELAWRWNAITNFYMDKKATDLKGPIEASTIPINLLEMNRLLEQEECEESRGEANESSGSIGPCMEYLLQNKLLDTMGVLAQADSPPGMCQEILFFFSRLLSNSNLNLLPHGAVYHAAQKLIMLCGKLEAGPYEQSEVEFLSCICQKLHDNPDLQSCFIRDSFPLITALLALLHSPDTEISTKAGDALLRLVSVVDAKTAQVITKETPFCSRIISQLVMLYESIPKTLMANEIKDGINLCHANNNSSSSESSTTNHHFPLGVRKFLCFLRWFAFYDMLLSNSANENSLSSALLLQFKEEFLEHCILRDFICNESALFTTVLLTHCFRDISCLLLSSTIGEFLLVESSNGQQEELLEVMLNRCNTLKASDTQPPSEQSFNLCLSTLVLLEEILTKPSQLILDRLLVQYVSGRGYHDVNTLEGSQFDFAGIEEPLRRSSPILVEDPSQVSPGSSPTNYPASRIYHVLQYFISLVPDELKSCDNIQELGYNTYIDEVKKHYHELASVCNQWEWPAEAANKTPLNCEDGSADSQPKADASIKEPQKQQFFEGPLLAMIFDNLEHIVHLPYALNLQVTTLTTKVAQIPHPNINEYLLDPTLPLARGTRSLFGVLNKVVDELQISVHGVQDLQSKLRLMRKSLMGVENESVTELQQDKKAVNLIQALIVIEEFCKELAALAYVKYQNMA